VVRGEAHLHLADAFAVVDHTVGKDLDPGAALFLLPGHGLIAIVVHHGVGQVGELEHPLGVLFQQLLLQIPEGRGGDEGQILRHGGAVSGGGLLIRLVFVLDVLGEHAICHAAGRPKHVLAARPGQEKEDRRQHEDTQDDESGKL